MSSTPVTVRSGTKGPHFPSIYPRSLEGTRSMDLDPEDVVYSNGEIIGTGSAPPAQAIFIQSGRIVSIGSNEDVLNVAGDNIPRIDLKGAVVIPGLIDTHPHLLHFAAFKANQLDITEAKNHAEILDAIRKRASETPKGEWIMTSPVGELHWFHKRGAKDLEEGGLPNCHVLDQATADHPVMIQALAPRNPNIVAFNSAALGFLEITSSTPGRVNNVWIEKDKDGEPTGILRGSVTAYYNQDPFFLSVLDRLPPLVQPERIPPVLVAAMKGYNAMGITTIYEGHAMEFEHIQGYQAMKAHNALYLRVKACPELEPKALGSEPDLTTSQITSNLEKAYGMRTLEDDWLRIDGVTACTYGPCCTGHGLVKKGYLSPSGEATTGKRVVSEENLRVAFDFCARTGLPLNLCSITPDEHDDHFTMTRETLQKHNLAKTNWIMQHGMLIRPDQIQQLVELGFDMTVSSAFTYGEGEIYRARIGPEALEILNPYRQLLDAGLNVAASMDWGPTNPFEQMELAVSHTMYPSRDSNAGPRQVVTRAEAFEMWTKHGAKVLRWPENGTLAVGNQADLAVVDRNPITCALADLPDTKVLRTLVGGRVVFDKGLLPFV